MVIQLNPIRYAEYYNMQDTFDKLYEKSKKCKPLNGLYEKIISDNNIKLAYRTVKSNKGSTTSGVYGLTIKDIKTS